LCKKQTSNQHVVPKGLYLVFIPSIMKLRYQVFARRKVKAMPATTKYDEGLRQMHAHIPLTIHRKLAARARKNHRSITGEAIAIIDQVLTATEQEERQPTEFVTP
jgi:hypothetical protein